MNDVFLGAVADDFTGATDLAAMLSRGGVPVTLRLGVPSEEAEVSAFEVVALKIRSVPVAEAVAEAKAAAGWLRARGARRLMWKYCSTFDSTPQGNIGPVAEALMDLAGAERTIHCPAFPENGRRVFMGHLFVGAQPLDESPLKDHPLNPMRDSSLTRLLAPQVARSVGLIDWPAVRRGAAAVRDALEAPGAAAHLIADALDDGDLAVLAEAARDLPLICGGSAVAAPLPALWRASGALGAAEVAPLPATAGQVVLSGSCSEATRGQVSAYLDAGAAGYRLDPLELAQPGSGALDDARRWLREQRPDAAKVVYATAAPAQVAAAQETLGAARAGAVVEDALARLAVDAREAGIGRIVVAGGETSGAVVSALGTERLRIGPEIAPGVPWCFDGGTALALKSGNFGGPRFFAEAFDLLDRAG
ncbi:four-carbon acid sugar kinase family protein [Jannaschia sp. Os4]|uniref:3-oxo-tetronate kinase n=1 Tax=Jannaschia sp. Os4 TaxID=2807617 RepID=UPI0019398A26|nr:3-oxo-tetronate kinase [Jannaschia sp. Os4]MBM2577782.1 four-carbon acid sugar kinase family protein [Jannaschia sp. Os4]